MSFLEKITGHRLRMHNTNRVMSNSVGIVCTLGVLSSLCDDIASAIKEALPQIAALALRAGCA